MTKFTWGEPIQTFEYDFDGEIMTVIKYHPWKTEGCTMLTGQPDKSEILYSCKELSESCDSLQSLVISWIARKNLGHNQHGLVAGVTRALGIFPKEESA